MEKCDWMEVVNEGKKYYYNKKTLSSTWEMPEEYKRIYFHLLRL